MKRAVSSSIKFPCSMVRTPASTARLIASGVYACARTYVPARCHHFDLIGTESDFITHGSTHFTLPIRNPAHPAEKMGVARCICLVTFNPFSGVPMPPSLADRATGYEEEGPWKESFLHCKLVPKICTTRIAH